MPSNLERDGWHDGGPPPGEHAEPAGNASKPILMHGARPAPPGKPMSVGYACGCVVPLTPNISGHCPTHGSPVQKCGVTFERDDSGTRRGDSLAAVTCQGCAAKAAQAGVDLDLAQQLAARDAELAALRSVAEFEIKRLKKKLSDARAAASAASECLSRAAERGAIKDGEVLPY